MIKEKTVLAISGSKLDSKYVDSWIIVEDLNEEVLRSFLSNYSIGAIVKTDSSEYLDSCIERSLLGNGCISTTLGKPNGLVKVAFSEWLQEHDFHHLGLLKCENDDLQDLKLLKLSDVVKGNYDLPDGNNPLEDRSPPRGFRPREM